MIAVSFDIPVVLLVFRRPALTTEVLARIRSVRPKRLFVVADGPRAGRPAERRECAEVRQVVEDRIDWPCDVVRDYADANLGCARRVSSGLTRVFEQVEQAIILEDDCVPDPTFFPFCTELLARYREDDRIAQIAGCCFRPPPSSGPSYYFSKYPHCWGWATWRRAWRHYDHAMTAWSDPASRAKVLRGFAVPAERSYWRNAFDKTAAGRIDSWAYRWTLACMARGALSANSATNLVANIGHDRDATHTTSAKRSAPPPVVPAVFPLVHPPVNERDAAADAEVGARWFHRPALWRRVLARLGN